MKAGDLNKYDLVKNTLVLILAGGRGSRLHELTDKRAKPALYFGGNRRIIDFALSNCINSGLNRIGVVTQYAAHSLLRHLQTGWSFLPQEKGEFVVIISPSREEESQDLNLNDIVDEIYEKVQSGVKKSEAIKNTAKEYGINKKEVYSLYHEKYD